MSARMLESEACQAGVGTLHSTHSCSLSRRSARRSVTHAQSQPVLSSVTSGSRFVTGGYLRAHQSLMLTPNPVTLTIRSLMFTHRKVDPPLTYEPYKTKRTAMSKVRSKIRNPVVKLDLIFENHVLKGEPGFQLTHLPTTYSRFFQSHS